MKAEIIGPAGSPHVETWLTAFRAAGHSVAVASLGDTRRHRPRALARSSWEIVQARISRPPDLTVVHSLGTHGLFALLRGLRGRVIVVPWGSEVMRAAEGGFRWKVARRLLTSADLVLVTSRTMAQSLEERWPGAARHLRVISWGADTTLFRPPRDGTAASETRQKLGLSDDEILVVSARGMRPVYQPSLIERAYLDARKVNPRLRLFVAGYDDDVRRPAETEQAYCLDGVRNIGWLSKANLAELYSVADAVVSMPTHDQRSTSVLEAASAGALLLLSDIPANIELSDDGLDCALLSASDQLGLASALRNLAQRTDSERETAHQWVQKHEAQSKQMRAIVEACLGQP